MRGTRLLPYIGRQPTQAHPRHAGNTKKCPQLLFSRRAHPRARGEHQRAWIANPKAQGSPRARGEHGLPGSRCSMAQGSPPRTRGTHASRGFLQQSFRLTPAPAGNTRPARNCPSCCEAHPRAAGNTDPTPSTSRAQRAHPRACGGMFSFTFNSSNAP